MKKYLNYIFAIILLVMTVVPNKAFATSYSGYTIEKYDINMIVNEDNTFDITETIITHFNVAKHGIYRKIPLKNNITRADGTKSNNIAKISNISVSEDYTISKENGYKVIKIGSSNETYTGLHSYTIKYTYNIGKDPLKNADELYFNLIGDEWDTSIKDVTFSITMPKAFDKKLLGFSSGDSGSTDSSNVYYSVDENVITGYLKNELSDEQALTVRLTLPDGYFVGASSNIDIYSVAVIVFCLICVLIADRLWAKYGKDDEIIETVEFYPPEGYNSAEVGFLYNGEADSKSIISLLIYLADKGYLKIEKIDDEEDKFRIIKLKEYDGNDANEGVFFNGLFKCKEDDDNEIIRNIMKEAKENGKEINFLQATEELNQQKKSVTRSDLYNNFYTTVSDIKMDLIKEYKDKIFQKSKVNKWLIMMIIAIFALITIKPVIEYSGTELIVYALLFPAIGFSALFGILFGKTPIAVKIIGTIWGLGFGGLPFALIVLPALTQNPIYLLMYFIGILSVIAVMLFIKIMPKRTKFGNEMLGKISGFKRFLEIAEKSQLENLVEQEPKYFYNILPYTYALGVSDIWIKQFENIVMQAPDWYDSTDNFNMHIFGTFMDETMKSATTAMSSSPSSDSSSSSSGGGSSGGGSGGGGGGSW